MAILAKFLMNANIVSKIKIKKTLPKHYIKRSGVDKTRLIFKSMISYGCLKLGVSAPWFSTPAVAVRMWMKWLRYQELPDIKGHIVIIALRNETWMDWALYAACWMRRLGYAPIVVYSSLDVEKIYGGVKKRTLLQKLYFTGLWDCLEMIPDVVAIDVDQMGEPSVSSMVLFEEFVKKQSFTVAAYELYVEEFEQGDLKSEYELCVEKTKREVLKETAQAYELFQSIGQEYRVHRVIGYSGSIGRSVCYEGAAQKLGMSRVWVEGWSILPGLLRWNIDKAALDFSVKEWVDGLGWSKEDQVEMETFLSFQESGKGEGASSKEHLKYQIVEKDAEWPETLKRFMEDDRPLFLMATNVVGDSATFQRQTIFESQRSWISEVVQYFKAHPNKRLIIRAHPSERVYELCGNLNVNLGKIAAEAAAGVENIYVVQWQDPVNTYSLIPRCRAGLIWVSNTGVDLVIRNIPAISAAFPVYGGLGITKEPDTTAEYFSLIEQLGKHEEEPSFKQKEVARKYLYVLYKKIGLLGFGPRYSAADLRIDLPMNSETGKLYRIIAGVE